MASAMQPISNPGVAAEEAAIRGRMAEGEKVNQSMQARRVEEIGEHNRWLARTPAVGAERTSRHSRETRSLSRRIDDQCPRRGSAAATIGRRVRRVCGEGPRPRARSEVADSSGRRWKSSGGHFLLGREILVPEPRRPGGDPKDAGPSNRLWLTVCLCQRCTAFRKDDLCRVLGPDQKGWMQRGVTMRLPPARWEGDHSTTKRSFSDYNFDGSVSQVARSKGRSLGGEEDWTMEVNQHYRIMWEHRGPQRAAELATQASNFVSVPLRGHARV